MATINLTGEQWGLFGSPPRGTVVEADWKDEVGPIGGWVFEHGGTDWYAFTGSPIASWAAEEQAEENEQQ